jgi:ubiquinone biosynthesis protein COQ4
LSVNLNFSPSDPAKDNTVPQPARPRLHPIAALRAVRKLMSNREDTHQVFLLIEALRGKTTLRQFGRFRQTETGRAVLGESRRLLDRLNDRASLAALPQGSLGRVYYDFMAAENLSAEALVEMSKIRRPAAPDAVTLFRERNREMHDLLHVVTGYGRDPLGEACLVAFSYAQTRLKGFAVIAVFAARRIAHSRPGQPVRRAVFEAYRHGRSSGWLPGADWEALLVQPVEAIRAQYAVKPPNYYRTILAAVRRLKDETNAGYAEPSIQPSS